MSFKQVFTVAGFTFKEAVRKKAFWITSIIYLIIVVAGAFLLPLIGGGGGMDLSDIDLTGEVHASGHQCYLLDESESPLFAGLADQLRAAGLQVTEITPAQLDHTLERVRENSGAALVHISIDDEFPLAMITTRDLMSQFPHMTVNTVLNHVYRYNQFAQAGHDMEMTSEILMSGVALGTSQLQDITNMIAGMLLVLVMFFTIYTYGASVAMSVATEKSTRVMETLVVSAKPSRILIGKCIGMGAAGLAQMLGVLLTITLVAQLTPSQSDGIFELPALGVGTIALLVLYFLLGFALFAMIDSVCGALVSKLEDVNNAMMPAMILFMASFYVGAMPMLMPGVMETNRITMLVPFTAPFAAPGLLLEGGFDPWLIAASVAILLATIVVVSYVSSKVYSASVLHYGSRIKFSELSKLIKGNKK